MSRLAAPARCPRPRHRASSPPAPPATQLELPAPGESRHFDEAPLGRIRINGPALPQTRQIASRLAGTRGWNPRIVIEIGRALAVILAIHQPET